MIRDLMVKTKKILERILIEYKILLGGWINERIVLKVLIERVFMIGYLNFVFSIFLIK